MRTFAIAALAAFAVLIHQTAGQDNPVEATVVTATETAAGGSDAGRRVRTLTLGENGPEFTTNGQSITDGRSADLRVNDNTVTGELQGRRASLVGNAGDENNVAYTRAASGGITKRAELDLDRGTFNAEGRRTAINANLNDRASLTASRTPRAGGQMADGGTRKRLEVDLDNNEALAVTRRRVARANENQIQYSKIPKSGGLMANGGTTKSANVDLQTGQVNVEGRRTLITGRLGGTGEDALRIQRIREDRGQRQDRRERRQDFRESRRGLRDDRRGLREGREDLRDDRRGRRRRGDSSSSDSSNDRPRGRGGRGGRR